jgi:hypothetical protein
MRDMAQPRVNPVARFLPSMTDVAFLMPAAFLFLRMEGATTMLGDGDTGWHVRTGEWILANGRVPHVDMFSFTKAGQPWFAWEWLWEVMFAWLHQRAGMAAVVLVSLLVISLASALLFRLMLRHCANVFIAMLVMVSVTACSAIHYLARPHLFTLLFAVIFYWILELAKEGRTRLLFWLPPLTAIWTNIHGGFFVGVIFACTYAAGELANAMIASDASERRAAAGRSKPYLWTALGCMLASLVNPYGYNLHRHIFEYLTDSYQYKVIMEFQSFNFHHPVTMYFEPMLAAGVAAAVWHLAQRRFVYAFLIVGWAHLALVAQRNVPIFMIAAAPPVAMALEEMLQWLPKLQLAGWIRTAASKLQTAAVEFGSTDRIVRFHLTSAAAAALLVALFYTPAAPAKCKAVYDPKRYPTKALAVLRGPELSRTIFTDDEWGDFLIYSLYPNTKVFVDGRSDFYGSRFGEKCLDVLNVKYDWEKNLSLYHINAILLPTDTPLAGTLKESHRWHSVYDDGVAIVFRSIENTAGSDEVSDVRPDAGKQRDHKVTKTLTRDPKVTQPNLRSEPS